MENPELSVEQCGNQAYTKWRNLLYEVVGQIPALNKIPKNRIGNKYFIFENLPIGTDDI